MKLTYQDPSRMYEETRGEEYEIDPSETPDSGSKATREKIYIPRKAEKVINVERRSSPRAMQRIARGIIDDSNTSIEPLKTIGAKINGNLFDRVEFIKTRISELTIILAKREQIHKKLIEEMDDDIDDREKMLSKTSKLEDQRELKLDLSLLKMEKRKEEMSFWRDTMVLKKELQELKEQFENESKIVRLFSDLNIG